MIKNKQLIKNLLMEIKCKVQMLEALNQDIDIGANIIRLEESLHIITSIINED